MRYRRRSFGVRMPGGGQWRNRHRPARGAARAYDSHRHGDAQHVGAGVSGKSKEDAAPFRGRGHDRPRLGRNRRASHEARGLRLHCQTLLAIGRIAPVSPAHGRESPPGRGKSVPARSHGHRDPTARHRRLLRQNSGRPAHGLPPERYAHPRADYRRKRHWKGIGGARDPLPRFVCQSAIRRGRLRLARAYSD